MSKTQVPNAKNIAKKQALAVKKTAPVKADSKAIKKTKSAVPVMSSNKSSQGSSKEESKRSKKSAPVKKAASKENQKPDTVQPKKAMSSYFAFLGQRRQRFAIDNPTLSVTELAKSLGQVWGAMNEDQKKPYYDIVEQDIARYQKEMKMFNTKGYFINKDGVNSKDLQKEADRKKTIQSGVQPKKGLSGFMFYSMEIQASVRSQNPDIKTTEVAKKIGEQWCALKDNEKTKWTNMAIKDKARSEKELNQLQNKGYFVNSDGVKSTDIVQKKFKYPDGTVMPKQPKSAYRCYVNENKQKIVDKQNCNSQEANQICEEVWKKLSDKQKSKYNTAHAVDAKRYEKQIIQVQTKGYYVLEDGSKSQ